MWIDSASSQSRWPIRLVDAPADGAKADCSSVVLMMTVLVWVRTAGLAGGAI
ncbi:sulfate adenylyltransferase, small subunit [Burkholderia pseudomallei TSV44]|nr:sulfate adenylyltransferase, small subunit domain protein [Burkholderia pseudomallei MSHR7504]KGX50868.1 sulfate adenylyltransferase, small subunit [Burkholderia pseudomallei TSV44]KGX54124.1 sulfate adenylyltransferase, small subunit [Burkholderia pseudomallei TSV32]